MPKKEFDKRNLIVPPGVELYSHLFVFKGHYVEKGLKTDRQEVFRTEGNDTCTGVSK